MGYEERGGRLHYYAKERQGRTVNSHHISAEYAPYFAGIIRIRKKEQESKRKLRAPIEETTRELKHLEAVAGNLKAALLYSAGYYRHRGTWRPRTRATLVQAAADAESQVFAPDTPAGAASNAGRMLARATRLGFDAQRPAHVAECDGLFDALGAVVASLDERQALPGDLWVLTHVDLSFLFGAWIGRAQALGQAILKRVPDADSLEECRRCIQQRERELASGNGSALSLLEWITFWRGLLCSVDRATLVAYARLHPSAYSLKQWKKLVVASEARMARAEQAYRDTTEPGVPHMEAALTVSRRLQSNGCVAEVGDDFSRSTNAGPR